MESVFKPSKIKWYNIEANGMPPTELWHVHIGPNKTNRTFLVRCDFSMTTATVFSDGSGFDFDNPYFTETPTDWAFVDNF